EQLVLQNEISNVDYIISRAYDIGMKTFFNPAPFANNVLAIDIEKIYCLIANEIEAKSLTATTEIEESIDYFIKHYPSLKTVITLGEKGSIYIEDGKITKQSAFKAEAVDTTAAGDTFVGYFVSCLSKGSSPSDALRIASIASAITVSRHGAAPSIPTIREVTSSTLAPKINSRKEQIVLYLDQNYANASLNELASTIGCSIAYTARWIKNTFGKSFSTLLKEKRCEVAARRLKNSDDKIGDIACKTGYANESFFRKAFTEIYGESPSSYRKSFRKRVGL
ncbi:MAG: PfkB family carbohydrate kinase, partial [Acutalibacteraceae bacterium]|nr:PfkB family carbohydrate kinase [Acutalibacteraceae bacterium]